LFSTACYPKIKSENRKVKLYLLTQNSNLGCRSGTET
jgi:hypothetical protein